jgi:mRNA interferase YafQ
MTRALVSSRQFRRDYKRLKARHGARLDQDLRTVLDVLAGGGVLPAKARDHQLVGWSPVARELHIRPDLLLVYRMTPDTVELVRMGTHSDLF